jgi:hypothetical protein
MISYYFEKIRSDPSYKGAVLCAKEFAQYLNKPKNVKRMKIGKETVVMIPVVMYMRQDFYLVDSIDMVLKNVKPTGLIDFWGSQDVARHENTEEVFYPKALGLMQFEGSFYILVIGWTISLIAFIVEIRVKKFHQDISTKTAKNPIATMDN